MDISMSDLRELIGAPVPATLETSIAATPWPIGSNMIVRTVTMTITGRLEEVHAQELVFSSAAWIADSGRWSAAVASDWTRTEVEVEAFHPDRLVIVGRGAVIDATVIDNLPKWTK